MNPDDTKLHQEAVVRALAHCLACGVDLKTLGTLCCECAVLLDDVVHYAQHHPEPIVNV